MYADRGVQIEVKYSIAVCLHAGNDYGKPVFSPCTTIDNLVAKCFTSQKALFRSVFNPSGTTVNRVSGKRGFVHMYGGWVCVQILI